MKRLVIGLVCLVLLHAVFSEEQEESDDLKIPSEEVIYSPPKLRGYAFLAETFDNGLGSRWVKSQAKKEDTDDDIAKYNGEWEVKEPNQISVKNDVGLVLTTRARHAAISAKLDKPFTFSGKPLIVQYEVKFQNGMDCGGAYMKLLSDAPGLDMKQVTDKSGYTIMFGPDTCGVDKKLHFIMRHKNPKTGVYEEKHSKKPSGSLDFFSDKKTHVFRLTVRPDNEWEVHVDDAMVNSGSLLEDMTPAVNPPAEIDDPNDFKPADWDDREKISDADATKPIDWDEDAPEFILDEEAVKPNGWLDDEPELVADPEASRPDDWDDEMDGEWEAAKIENPKCAAAPGCGEWKRPNKRNPNYRGKWVPPMIENPDYSGVWAPRRIANPDYFEDNQPYRMTPIGAVAFELWTMTDGVLFDNILITDDEKVADAWTSETWHIKRDAEMAAAARDSPGWMDTWWRLTEEKPWVWALLVLSFLVPIGVIVFCCMGSSKDEAAEKKKTDEPTADDQEEEEKEEAMAAGDSQSSSKYSPSKAGRAALNEPADEDEAEPNEDAAKADEEAEASLDEGSKSAGGEASDGDDSRRKSPRKRKSRKE